MSFSPIFEKGLILKQHMLEALRDYPYDFVNTLFSDRGEGIISGMDVSLLNDGSFCINIGIIKINGNIYFLTNKVVLKPMDELNYVYAEIVSTQKVDGTEYIINIIQKNTEDERLFEIFRYIKNATLREYSDITEIFCETTNRVDQRYTKKSVIGGSLLCDKYFRLFANHVLCNSKATIQDISFAYQCLNGFNNLDVVKSYFKEDNITNDKILFLMEKRVQELENSEKNEPIAKPTQEPEKKMYIS